LYREIKRKIVANVRDVLIQEVMTISNSEFEGEAIDMDSVAFAGKSKPFLYKKKHLKYRIILKLSLCFELIFSVLFFSLTATRG